MANSLFLAMKQEALGDAAGSGHGVCNFETATIKVIGIDTADDDPLVNTDQDLADILAAARVGTATLASKTVTTSANTATFDSADPTMTAVTGDQFEELLLYKDSGVESTSLLLISFDTFTSGMPVTPNGGDILITWNASGIFAW